MEKRNSVSGQIDVLFAILLFIVIACICASLIGAGIDDIKQKIDRAKAERALDKIELTVKDYTFGFIEEDIYSYSVNTVSVMVENKDSKSHRICVSVETFTQLSREETDGEIIVHQSLPWTTLCGINEVIEPNSVIEATLETNDNWVTGDWKLELNQICVDLLVFEEKASASKIWKLYPTKDCEVEW